MNEHREERFMRERENDINPIGMGKPLGRL